MARVLPAPETIVLRAVQDYNILPLTSRCNVRCIFCSHCQNPPEVEVYSLPPRTREQVRRSMEFLDGERKIVIGESATRIMEGEPLTHPEVLPILQEVRERFPTTAIQLTTNGSLLTARLAAELAQLQPLEINLSLNSADPGTRAYLMGEREGVRAVAAPTRLAEAGIAFHGSVVAIPWLVGWEELRQTVLFLARNGARTVRVFMPGFTRLAPPELRFPPELWEELDQAVRELAGETPVPVTLEPPRLQDLAAVIEGVIPGSPAAREGIRRGDTILQVAGEQVTSRVDAFYRTRRWGNPRLMVQRGSEKIEAVIQKGAGETSGLVLAYDLDPGLPALVEREARRRRARRVLLLCSQLGETVLGLALKPLGDEGLELFLHPVPSRFFGGSIMAAGLLVVSDFLAAFQEFQARHPVIQPDLVLLPAIAFDRQVRDLTGRSMLDLQEAAGCPVSAL
ncbi:hypothetical protein SY88_09160 [Clostridiales bacterium PH28_bin88]|nr:hypothetical protein SY88_09160 [Clostridiales bacterium PH28_bin88]